VNPRAAPAHVKGSAMPMQQMMIVAVMSAGLARLSKKGILAVRMEQRWVGPAIEHVQHHCVRCAVEDRAERTMKTMNLKMLSISQRRGAAR
jgi:hypothetical protein